MSIIEMTNLNICYPVYFRFSSFINQGKKKNPIQCQASHRITVPTKLEF